MKKISGLLKNCLTPRWQTDNATALSYFKGITPHVKLGYTGPKVENSIQAIACFAYFG